MIRFCPCDHRFKNIIGGVRAGTAVDFTVLGYALEAALIMTKEGEGHNPVRYPMEKIKGGFNVKITITTAGLYFYFFVIDGARFGADELLELKRDGDDFLQLVYEGEFTPLCGPVYQIFPDRFYRAGDFCGTGVHYEQDWFSTPTYLPDESGNYNTVFYGGNLKGITAKLDYIASLKMKYIYLNPIFKSSSNHRYDTGDYEKIDEILGDENDMVSLISEAKSRGMGIILDGVFSHTGADSKYFNRYGHYESVGAYMSKDSPYFSWYKFTSYPNEYSCWWGFKSLPEVNETDPAYLDYMLGENGIIYRWESLGIAGWRLDVADELPDEFLSRLKSRSRGTIIGEVWENAARKISYGFRRKYFLGGQLDGVINYPFRTAVISYVMSRDNTLLRKTLRELLSDYPLEALLSTLNVLSTHDTFRILTALSCDEIPTEKEERAAYIQSDVNEAKKRLKLAAAIQYFLPGVPCLFYGDEAGLTGHEDPFCRKCYPWGREDDELIAHYRKLGELRNKYSDSLIETSEVSPSKEVFALIRSGKSSLALVVNMGSSTFDGQFLGGAYTFSALVPPSSAALITGFETILL